MPKISFLACLSLLCFGASCGYRWSPQVAEHGKLPSVAVAYAEGDEDGAFTSALIQELVRSKAVLVQNSSAEYRLQISLTQKAPDVVGYRRDPQKVKGKIRQSLVACEGRIPILAEVTLFHGDEVAFGPSTFLADADYDYVDGDSLQDLAFIDSQGKLITVLPFSLGQLESPESAIEAARRPLYARLSRTIVDTLLALWKIEHDQK